MFLNKSANKEKDKKVIEKTDRKLRSNSASLLYEVKTPIGLSVELKELIKTPQLLATTSSALPAVKTEPVKSSITAIASAQAIQAAAAAVLVPVNDNDDAVSSDSESSESESEIREASDQENMGDGINHPAFCDSISQDAQTWFDELNDWMAYKNITGDKRIAVFKLKLAGGAKQWLQSLPDTEKDTFDNLKVAFIARFKAKEFERHKYLSDLFSEKQEHNQSVDSYVTQLRNKAARVQVDEKMQISAALNGLKPKIAAFCMQHKLETMDELMEQAKIYEFTNKSVAEATGDEVMKKLDKITTDMSNLNDRVGRLTISQVREERSYSKSPDRRVKFAETAVMVKPLAESQRGHYEYKNAQRRPMNYKPAQGMYQQQQPLQHQSDDVRRSQISQELPICWRCGKNNHLAQECGLQFKSCYKCSALGHAAVMCQEKRQF